MPLRRHTNKKVTESIAPFVQGRAIVFLVGMSMLLGTAMLMGQTSGKISGTVTDGQTKEALLGVNIVIAGSTMGAATGLDGTFFILNIPPGEYDLVATMIGYRQVVMRGVIVNAGRTTTADFELSETVLAMEEVVVQAVRPDVEKEKTSTSAIVRFDDVRTLPGIRDVRDILGLAADVTDGHFRGGRLGE